MTDLVIDHTARDSRLAGERPELFQRDENGELRSPYAIDPDDRTKRTVWTDLAKLDYDTVPARRALTEYWDRYIAHVQGLGVRGFRCDAAYKVPPEVWRDLIGAARLLDRDRRDHDVNARVNRRTPHQHPAARHTTRNAT